MDLFTASSVQCRRCSLACSRKSIVDGAGHPQARLVVVAEQPGREEDRASSPLVGAGGRLVRSAIAIICQRLGVDAEQVFYTYAVRCRGDDVPSTEQLLACEPWLLEELEAVQPRCVLALGATAQWQVCAALDYWPEYAVPSVKKAYAPGYILKNRNKLDNWLVQVEAAIRRAFELPEVSTERGTAEPWYITDNPENMTGKWFAADTETDDLAENFSRDLVGWSLSDGTYSMFRTDPPSLHNHVYLHNAKYDLMKLGIDPDDLSAWDDTMLMAYNLRRFPRLSLKELGPMLTGIEWDTKIKDMLKVYVPTVCSSCTGTGKAAAWLEAFGSNCADCGGDGRAHFKTGPRKGQEKPGKWVKAPFSRAIETRWAEASKYAATDAVVTSRLAMVLDGEMHEAPWARSYYEKIEKPLLPVLLSMEQAGVRIDTDALAQAEQVILERRAETEAALREVFGPELNLASGQQMGPVLYEMGIVDGKRTDTGDIATAKPNILGAFGADTAEEIPADTFEGRVARDLLEWRQMGKLKSTYVDALLSRLDANSRVHGRYNQSSTNTNRLSSSDPNLQNIPARTDIGMAIRRAFVADPGNVMVGGDFSQLQLRLFGELTGEPVFVNAYRGDGADFHQYAADKLGRPRKIVKNFVFAVLFGADGPKAAATAGVPLTEATGFMHQLKEEIPSLVTWQDLTADLLSTQGYVESLMGWRGFFPDYAGMVNKWSAAALREAANFRVQATEAGLVKAFMAAVYGNLKRDFPAWRLILQVHDEIWSEGPEREAAAVEQMMAETATSVARRWITAVPIKFETKTVMNWKEGK